MMDKSSKLQHPSSKEAPNSKLQNAHSALFRVWRLVLLWCLVLEAWSFRPSALASPNEQKEIQDLYRRGLRGDKEAVEQCIAKLEGILRTEPQNQLARVYLGSAYTLRSRDLGFGPKKLQALKHGLAVMDQAVGAAPDEPKVRLARALTTSALPAIFGRRSESRNDFELLRQMLEQHPEKFDAADAETVRAQTSDPRHRSTAN
jgi:hypothetical protein